MEKDYARLVSALGLMCGDRGAAEDAVQEALVRAWEHKMEVRSLAAWVTTVAVNLLRSRWRRLVRERRAVERLESKAMSATEPIDLRNAVSRLPKRQREVIVLRYYLDFDIEEVASMLRITAATVRVTLLHGRRALARALGEEDPDGED